MTGIIGRYKQNPDERLHYAIDCSQWLDSTEVVTGASFTVSPVTSPPLVVNGNYIAVGNLAVVFYVSGGVAGQTYKVFAEIGTSTGQLLEETVQYTVVAP